jgi:hypothetical protein
VSSVVLHPDPGLVGCTPDCHAHVAPHRVCLLLPPCLSSFTHPHPMPSRSFCLPHLFVLRLPPSPPSF